MPLTPEDVSDKRFTPVRLREGYDMGEVDQFLDEVEAELGRLHEELDSLRSTAAGAPAPTPPATTGTGTAAEPAAAGEPAAAAEPEDATGARTVSGPAEGGGVETIRVATVSEASGAAARLLELATRNADQLVEEARGDAERILGEARTEATRVESASKEKADRTEAEARSRSEMLDSETAERRTRLFGDLETERDALSSEVDDLRSFEREYRSRLKAYFHQQLEALDGEPGSGDTPVAPADAPAPTPAGEQGRPTGLRSILGEDQG